MEWNEIKSNNDLPKKEGFYQCYVPESRNHKEHHDEYWFDGKDFRDGDSMAIWTDTRKRGFKATKYITHWMKIEHPSY